MFGLRKPTSLEKTNCTQQLYALATDDPPESGFLDPQRHSQKLFPAQNVKTRAARVFWSAVDGLRASAMNLPQIDVRSKPV